MAIMVAVSTLTRLFLGTWIMVGLLGLVALLFGTLTIEIRSGVLECRFGIGIIRKRIPLVEIRGARPVRNRWYYGWGVRYTPQGGLFSVSGLGAVEITLASGRKVRLGTDRPDELSRAIAVRTGINSGTGTN